MSSFTCLCGHVTYDCDEPAGASLVAVTLADLRAAEQRIAERVADLVGPATRSLRALQDDIEDIVSGALNERLAHLYRCPACSRLALKDGEAERWQFFSPVAQPH